MCTLLRSSPTTAASSLACVPGLETMQNSLVLSREQGNTIWGLHKDFVSLSSTLYAM